MPRNAAAPESTLPRMAPSLSWTTGCCVISLIRFSVATFARYAARQLTEILWSLIRPTVDRLRTEHSGPAAANQSPAAAVIVATVRGVIANPGMQRFLDREGELALRMLTTRASDFETRLIALIGEFVCAEAADGRLNAAVPLDDLPYVLVRIMESYIYLGLITGEHPDPDRAARVINALLPSS